MVDVLEGLHRRNCHYIIWNILDNLGLVSLASVFQVCHGWREICVQYMEARLSLKSRQCFDMLLSSDQDDPGTSFGLKLAHLSVEEGHLDVLKLTKQKYWGQQHGARRERARRRVANVFQLCKAAKSGHLDVVKWIIEEKTGYARFIRRISQRPIICATEGGHFHVLKYLIDKYHYDVNKAANTKVLLGVIARSGQIKVLQKLMTTCGMKVTLECAVESQILHFAIQWRRTNVIEQFIQSFPKADPKIWINETIQWLGKRLNVIHAAARHGALDVLKLVYDKCQRNLAPPSMNDKTEKILRLLKNIKIPKQN